MAMLNAPTTECDRINLRRSGPVQKRQQIFETVPVRHRGTSFRSTQLFLTPLHRADLSPRLSTFERCWLGGATGLLAQRSGETHELFALRFPDQSARSAFASSSIFLLSFSNGKFTRIPR